MAHPTHEHTARPASLAGVASLLLVVFLLTLGGHMLFIKGKAAEWLYTAQSATVGG